MDSLKWFKSEYTKLRILPDHQCAAKEKDEKSSIDRPLPVLVDEKSMESILSRCPSMTPMESPVPSYSRTPSYDMMQSVSPIPNVQQQPQYFVAVPVLVNFDSSNSVENQLAFSQQQIDHHMQSAQYFQQFLPSDSQTVFINDTPSAFMNETCSETPSFDPQ